MNQEIVNRIQNLDDDNKDEIKELVEIITSENKENSSLDDEGNTALHLCIKHNKSRALLALINDVEDIDVNKKNHDGDTPLLYAAKFDNYHCFEFLYFAGAEQDIINNQGESVFDIVSELQGPDPNTNEYLDLLMNQDEEDSDEEEEEEDVQPRQALSEEEQVAEYMRSLQAEQDRHQLLRAGGQNVLDAHNAQIEQEAEERRQAWLNLLQNGPAQMEMPAGPPVLQRNANGDDGFRHEERKMERVDLQRNPDARGRKAQYKILSEYNFEDGVLFDPVDQEDRKIQEYLEEEEDNIVFILKEKNNYMCYGYPKSQIGGNRGTDVYHDCQRKPDGSYRLDNHGGFKDRANLNKKEYIKISLTYPVFVEKEDLIDAFATGERVFFLGEPVIQLLYTYSVGSDYNAVSAFHCQNGTDIKVYSIYVCEQMK